MKTQAEIDVARAKYRAHWELDMRRLKAKLAFAEAQCAALDEIAAGGVLSVLPQPGELLPGLNWKRERDYLADQIEWREAQWTLIEDGFNIEDVIRAHEAALAAGPAS